MDFLYRKYLIYSPAQGNENIFISTDAWAMRITLAVKNIRAPFQMVEEKSSD